MTILGSFVIGILLLALGSFLMGFGSSLLGVGILAAAIMLIHQGARELSKLDKDDK